MQQIDKVEYFTRVRLRAQSAQSTVYDLGFGHFLFPINNAVNTCLNQMFVNAGLLQNAARAASSAAASRSTPGRSGSSPGEFKPVNAMGSDVRDAVYVIPFPGPSNVLFQLLDFLVKAAQDVASVKDVLAGEMPADNTSGISILATIEQGLAVYTSIHKRILRALTYEGRRLYRLNRLYLPATMAGYSEQGVWRDISRKDYELGGGAEPVADTRMATNMQQLGHAQFLGQYVNDPRVDGAKVLKYIFEAAGVPDAGDFLTVQPQPDPKVVLRGRELDIREKREAADIMLRQQHDKSLIFREIAQAILFVNQARKLENDAMVDWAAHQLEILKASYDAIEISWTARGETGSRGRGR